MELAELERVNARLADRQEALVALQTAVLNLWGHVSDDPLFVAANSEVSGSPRGRRWAGLVCVCVCVCAQLELKGC